MTDEPDPAEGMHQLRMQTAYLHDINRGVWIAVVLLAAIAILLAVIVFGGATLKVTAG